MSYPELLNYVHYPLNEEVKSIGGHYVITEEICQTVQDRQVLITIGYAVMDTTCCGTGGCGYATVHGFVDAWMKEINTDGLSITKVRPIRDDEIKEQLKEMLLKKNLVQQVNFL